MPATITTRAYCAVRNNSAFEGVSKRDVLEQICSWYVDDNRLLQFMFENYPWERGLYFSREFTDEEMEREAITYLWNRVTRYGFRVYRDIGV